MADPQLTQGAAIVAGLVKRLGASAMARQLECGESLVRAHALGERMPRPRLRDRYREKYDVPVGAWDAPASAAAPTPRTPESPPASTPAAPTSGPPGTDATATDDDEARAAVVDLLRVARAELEAAQRDSKTGYREKAGLINSATGLCRLLARLSGSLDVTEAQILRSAAWARLVKIIREVLENHPAAAAELDKAMVDYEQGAP